MIHQRRHELGLADGVDETSLAADGVQHFCRYLEELRNLRRCEVGWSYLRLGKVDTSTRTHLAQKIRREARYLQVTIRQLLHCVMGMGLGHELRHFLDPWNIQIVPSPRAVILR